MSEANLVGTVNFLKPPGMTSHNAVSFMRKLLNMRKIGHTGTLDPMVAGVLPICLGSSTRLIEYASNKMKSYRCEMEFGKISDTQDIWGEVSDFIVGDSTMDEAYTSRILFPDENEIQDFLNSMTGNVKQKIPNYSATKHNGKKMYDYARSGEKVPEKYKDVVIEKIDLVNLNRDTNKMLFDVRCSKGTYVRTICHDIGEAFEVGGVMTKLIRTESDGFLLKDTVTNEELTAEMKSRGNINKYIGNHESLLGDLEKSVIANSRVDAFIRGLGTTVKNKSDIESVRVYSKSDKFLGIGYIKDGILKPKKVIYKNT